MVAETHPRALKSLGSDRVGYSCPSNRLSLTRQVITVSIIIAITIIMLSPIARFPLKLPPDVHVPIETGEYSVSRCGVILFSTPCPPGPDLVQVLLAPRPNWCDCEPAPEPRDIIWENVSVPRAQVTTLGERFSGEIWRMERTMFLSDGGYCPMAIDCVINRVS